MRQAIRALGWAIYILWLVIIVFTVTAVYSAFQLGLEFGEEPQVSTSGGTVTLTLPFSVENNGFYDINDLNVTTILQESNGALVSNSSTVLPLISSGNKVNATHNISISLENMTSASLSRLLFYDTDLDMDMSLALRYAGVIPFKISTNIKNFTRWGAPLYNLTIGNPYFADSRVVVPTSFENHSFFNLTGTMRLELVNNLNQQVGAGVTEINAPSQSVYSTSVGVTVSDPRNIREARLYFDTSVFSYGPVVMPIG